MRISSNLFYDQISKGLKESLSDLNEANLQLATGKKINKPSDDVLGTLKVLDYKLSISQNTQFEQNITEANNYLSFDDTILTQVRATLDTLKSLTQQTGGSAAQRTVYAEEAANLRDTLFNLSNSTYLNNYVFSGSQSGQAAYVFDGTAHQYQYQGDLEQVSVAIGKGINLSALNIPGNSNDATLLSPFSTMLTAPQTSTLLDGSTVTYTPVVDPDPTHHYQTIQVDIINPNKQPTDPGYQDTFSFSNVMDIANIISCAFNNQGIDGNPLSADATANAQMAKNRIEALSEPVGTVRTQALSVQALVGTRQIQLKDQKTRLENNTLTAQDSLGQTQDADMNETALVLQKISTTLNALRSTAAKVLPESLFDFLK
jgi:flagellar hook-associated protein 3